MLDHCGPYLAALLLASAIVTALQVVTIVLISYLVRRRHIADRERRAMRCPECRELERVVSERKRRERWTMPLGGE